MNRAVLERRDGALVWVVSSATKGSGLMVMIDDAIGAAIKTRRWGIR